VKNHTPSLGNKQIQIQVSDAVEEHTAYAGLLSVQKVWQRLGVSELLDKADIHYGCEGDQAEEMSFVLTVGPFVGATSVTKAAQRFGGEPSPHGQEVDPLLKQMLACAPSQRKLSRFTSTNRYEWAVFQEQRLKRLLDMPAFSPRRKGVILLDDYPLARPYAEKMAYLSPIKDSTLKRTVMGYAIVHLYYDLPGSGGYSLYVEPWLKTSKTGETVPKPRSAFRRAKEGEERSKLDMALDALERYLPIVQHYEALVMDSWYTVRWFCATLSDMTVPWVGEAGEDRKFLVAGHKLWVKEIAQFYRKRKKRIKGLGRRRRVHAVAIPAIWPKDRFTPIDQPVLLVLVTGLNRARADDKGYKLLVCNQMHWTAKHIVRLFARRPRIEQKHRDGKQHGGWKDYHSRSLQALLCHLALGLLRMDLLRLCWLYYPIAATYSLAQMIDHLLRYVALLTCMPASGLVWVQIPSQHPALGFWT
jgi:hypothetical protein